MNLFDIFIELSIYLTIDAAIYTAVLVKLLIHQRADRLLNRAIFRSVVGMQQGRFTYPVVLTLEIPVSMIDSRK